MAHAAPTPHTHTTQRAYVREFFARLVYPMVLLLLLLVTGTCGYFALGGGTFSLLDCLYMASITLTTVGYGEVVEIQTHPHRDLLVGYTIVLMWVGMGVTLYAVSSITAFIVERHLGNLLRGRKMLKQIQRLQGHTIVCGAGRTGTHIIGEYVQSGRPFVVIDQDPAAFEDWREHHPRHELLCLQGDATDESLLERAGIRRAEGLIASLNDDAHNLLLVITARTINPTLRIVAKVLDVQFSDKMSKAGADRVVSPTFIGGMRLASEMLRPHVVTFLDYMLRSGEGSTRVGEVVVGEGSSLAQRSLGAAKIYERTGMNVVAMDPKGEHQFLYNPSPDVILEPGSVLIVIGAPHAIQELEQLAR